MKKLTLIIFLLIAIGFSCTHDKSINKEDIVGTWAFSIETDTGLFDYYEIEISDSLITYHGEDNLIEHSKYKLWGNQLEFKNKKILLELVNDYTLTFTEENNESIQLLRINLSNDYLNKYKRDDVYIRKYYFLINQGLMSASDAMKELCAEASGNIPFEETEIEINR